MFHLGSSLLVNVDAQLVTVNDHAMPFRASSSEDGSFTEIGITTWTFEYVCTSST